MANARGTESRRDADALALTVRDVVVLALLAEGATYGYAIEAELQRRDVRDWADISRPQVYKSLEKIARLGFARAAAAPRRPRGPAAAALAVTAAGRRALRLRLAARDWMTQRERPAFLTWLALCWALPADEIAAGIAARRAFLQRERAREAATLDAVARDATVTTPYPSAMVELTIRQFSTELQWLDELTARLETPAP